MSKLVRTVLIVAAAVAIVAFAPEIAGALGPAISGGLGILSYTGVAAATSALTGIALSLGLTAAMSLFQKTPNLSQSNADRQDLNPDPAAPRKIVFGNTAAGTDIRFKESWGSKSDRLSLVIALASHRLSSVQSVTMDSTVVWQNGTGLISSKLRDGIDEVDPRLVGIAGQGRAVGTGNFWSSSATFTGCAYSVITYKVDKAKVWTTGLPSKVIHQVEGCPVYDPRLDSNNGGNGPLSPTDQSTWRYNADNTKTGLAIGRNPALCLLTYLIGWRTNGILQWGMGLPVEAIDMASFILYANLCEEQVTTSTGGTTQRYTCDAIFSTTDSHQTIINSISICMGTAILVDTNGMFQLIEGFDDTLVPAYSLGADDIISSGVWTPSPAVRERVTRITGRFADPTQQYALNTWGTIDADPFFDGIPRVQNTDFGGVSRPETAQRIAKQMLVKSKYCGTYTAVFGYRAFAAPVGSLVTLTGPNGWNAKLFRVTSAEETFDLTYQLVLREESPEVYEWDASEEKPLPANIFETTFDPVETEDVEGLTIAARTVAGTNSVDTIYIDVSWTPPSSLRAQSIEIQSMPAGGSIWTTEVERFAEVSTGKYTFGAGVNGAGVNVQARYRMDNGAYGAWVSAALGSTPVSSVNQWSAIYDGGAGTKPADGADVTANNTAKDTAAVAGVPAATVISNVSAAQATIAQHESDIEALKSEVASAVDPDLTKLNNDIAQAQSDATSALSQISTVGTEVTNLTSTIGDNNSGLVQTVASQATAVQSLSGDVTDLTTNFNNNSSSVSGVLTPRRWRGSKA